MVVQDGVTHHTRMPLYFYSVFRLVNFVNKMELVNVIFVNKMDLVKETGN